MIPDARFAIPVLCVGGTCKTEGFAVRFQQECQRMDSRFVHNPVAFPQDSYSAWRGASFLCCSEAFATADCWLTKEKMENGNVTTIRKSLF